MVVVGADPVGVVAAVGAVGVEPLEACGVVGLQSSTTTLETNLQSPT